MNHRPRILLLAVLAAAIAIASCRDAAPPTALAPSAAELFGGLTLLECTPYAADSSSARIGPAGGSIDVGPHRFVVPPGALDSTVLITALAPSSTVNLVRFSPDGLEFERPATLTMSYANCGLVSWLIPRRIVLVDGELNILEVLPSLTDLWHQETLARVEHFSDYAVAW